MALKRAVEISHGRGLSGMPVFGHDSRRQRTPHASTLRPGPDLRAGARESPEPGPTPTGKAISIVLLICSGTGDGIYAKLANGAVRNNSARGSSDPDELRTLVVQVETDAAPRMPAEHNREHADLFLNHTGPSLDCSEALAHPSTLWSEISGYVDDELRVALRPNVGLAVDVGHNCHVGGHSSVLRVQGRDLRLVFRVGP